MLLYLLVYLRKIGDHRHDEVSSRITFGRCCKNGTSSFLRTRRGVKNLQRKQEKLNSKRVATGSEPEWNSEMSRNGIPKWMRKVPSASMTTIRMTATLQERRKLRLPGRSGQPCRGGQARTSEGRESRKGSVRRRTTRQFKEGSRVAQQAKRRLDLLLKQSQERKSASFS